MDLNTLVEFQDAQGNMITKTIGECTEQEVLAVMDVLQNRIGRNKRALRELTGSTNIVPIDERKA